jgi:hypothetical protein
MTRESSDFMEILGGFFDRLSGSGAFLFPNCREIVTETAKSALSHIDLHYVPGHKITEFMADLVNVAASISSEGWLSEDEARAQFTASTAPGSALMQHFFLEARMEQARYEPIMLTMRFDDPRSERNAILRQRLKRMLEARQSYQPMPNSFIRAIRIAGHHAIHAHCFSAYRVGPMLQFFADMIEQANQVAAESFDELAGLAALNTLLRAEGRLWKLYRYKAPRFSAKPGDPLHDGVFGIRATMLYIPGNPSRTTIH